MMKPSKIILSLLFVLVLSSCLLVPREYVDLETRTLDAVDIRSVFIRINHGELLMLGTESGQLEVGGQASFPDEMDIHNYDSDGQMVMDIEDRHSGIFENFIRVKILVPNQMKVIVETDSASVHVQDYFGDVEVASTSGNVIVENTIGELKLRSNRGNITVRRCSGRISVVGNYGTLSMQDTHGETGISTIMGTVAFIGMIQDGDNIDLETDHGLVGVDLQSNSTLEVSAHSTSGDVTCLIPNLSSTTRSCEGQIGDGGGVLNIRTVSGAVTIRLLP